MFRQLALAGMLTLPVTHAATVRAADRPARPEPPRTAPPAGMPVHAAGKLPFTALAVLLGMGVGVLSFARLRLRDALGRMVAAAGVLATPAAALAQPADPAPRVEIAPVGGVVWLAGGILIGLTIAGLIVVTLGLPGGAGGGARAQPAKWSPQRVGDQFRRLGALWRGLFGAGRSPYPPEVVAAMLSHAFEAHDDGDYDLAEFGLRYAEHWSEAHPRR